jgi:ATP-dependent DNA helicase RecG
MLSDDTGTIKAVWFRQPYLTKTIQPGDELFLSGKIEGDLFSFQMINPAYEKVKLVPLHTARLVPVYPTTAGVTQKQLRFLINYALPTSDSLDDWLPRNIIEKYNFLQLKDAVRQIHYPETRILLEKARARIGFDELFLIQIGALKIKYDLAERQAPVIKFQEEKIKTFVGGLPFQLTNSQKKASWEIVKDLEKNRPMNRLLEGDVGSGKTVVAALGMLNCALNGFQSALLSPTEILAQQHFDTLCRIFSNEKQITLCLLTSNHAKINSGKSITNNECRKLISAGKIDIIIGTHAIIQDRVGFLDLAYIVIDEQHRFGVKQRLKIKTKNPKNIEWLPHLLSMTATPIPRTLALTVYGDLDLSIINELPKGRKPVITNVIPKIKRTAAYGFIEKEIKKGQQVFVICPLIEESDKLGVKAVTTEFEKLNEDVFPHIKIGMLHGKMKSDQKEEIMSKFLNNEYKILVSTSVIEVGVDVPNATIMMIEGADRFGLAQLHQFRGRVGRSNYQSYCFLFTEMKSPEISKRLSAFVRSNNGFNLAEMDLALRGPGEVYGNRQSGYFPNVKIARLSDYESVKKARFEAEQYLENDPRITRNQYIQKKIEEFTRDIHLE